LIGNGVQYVAFEGLDFGDAVDDLHCARDRLRLSGRSIGTISLQAQWSFQKFRHYIVGIRSAQVVSVSAKGFPRASLCR
jgi:hypothetical protein